MNEKQRGAVSVTIVIVNFNSANYCIECLNSIQQSHNISFSKSGCKENKSLYYADVVVVDNCSEDDSVRLIRKLHPWVKLIESKQNLGYSAANNIGAKKFNNQYLLLLNPDTVLEPGTLEGMLGYIRRNERIGLTTCYLEMKLTGEIDWACHRGLPTPWASFCYYSGLSRFFQKSRLFGGYHMTWENFQKEHEIFSPVGAFFLFPTRVYWFVGGLDEAYFMYGEDLDIAYKVKSKGFLITYNPAYMAYHYKGASSNIKNHSKKEVTYSQSDTLKAYNAFYDSMLLFYDKFLRAKYPFFINQLVYWGIELKRKLGMSRNTV